MAVRRPALTFAREHAFDLSLAALVLVFLTLVRPPLEVASGRQRFVAVTALVAVILPAVLGWLFLTRLRSRHSLLWGAVAVVAMVGLVLSLVAYSDLRTAYSVDHEGVRIIVGTDEDLTSMGKLYREVNATASREALVRGVAGRPQEVWERSALRRHADEVERWYFVSAALASLAAVGLAGVRRARWRPAPEPPAQPGTTAASTPGAAPARRFRVALSFPGEVRDRAKGIADVLQVALGRERVFYDRWYAGELARPNMDTYLQEIYRNESDLLVVLLCAEYQQKEWCGLEWRVVRDLVKSRESSRIMFLRLDQTPIEGLLSIDGYLDITNLDDEAVGTAILSRVPANPVRAADPA